MIPSGLNGFLFMRSLERVFQKIRNQNPYWSDYICFAETVKNQKFSRKAIMAHFNNLVDEDDYDKKDKKTIVRQLCDLSWYGKMAEDG